jgi:hypothetical protein
MKEISINLDVLKDTALRGIRRATVFMGLGINAAADETFKNYELDKYTPIQFIPNNLNDKVINHFKKEFEYWIIMNGLRELNESFSLFLDEVFHTCAIVSNSNSKQVNRKIINNFSRLSLREKVIKLEELFFVKVKHSKYIYSINKARNCYTHRKGIVSIEDCKNCVLEIKWISLDLSILLEDNEIINPELPLKDPIKLKTAGKVQYKYVDRKIQFHVGEVIRLTPKQLSEICYFFKIVVDEVMIELYQFLQTSGIEVRKPE